VSAQSNADHRTSPPRIDIPREYNAAVDLIERNLEAGRAGKTAFIDDRGSYTFAELAERVNRFGNVLASLEVEMEQRIALALLDTIDFPTAFLGAIKAGVVPVALNTLLTTRDYEFMLRDSRARVLVVSEALLPTFAPLFGKLPHLRHVLVSGSDPHGFRLLATELSLASPRFDAASTTCDDMCFWLYSSGSTGAPKGTVHIHSDLIYTAELYGRPVLGGEENDVCFSAAKLFFAYGLGNGLTFPLAVGATAVLLAERPTPESVFRTLRKHSPTLFFGVPTLYAALLASPDLPKRGELRIRRCVSAGEALPADIGRRWSEHFGVDILDGIGSTEMLHIFLSNRPENVQYGTTGRPVPGYEVRLVDDHGNVVPKGEQGELQVRGPTSPVMYWNNRAKSLATFLGPWTRSGDKYFEREDGCYVYCGRTDDMLKVSGIYVSPFEVEAALAAHQDVLEAAVIGIEDDERLVKPKAYVVLKPGRAPSSELEAALKAHVKDRLAPYKYPRWIEFVSELPKTATGKIQRFKLRQQAGSGSD
jgi:benzoate-CoA ligase